MMNRYGAPPMGPHDPAVHHRLDALEQELMHLKYTSMSPGGPPASVPNAWGTPGNSMSPFRAASSPGQAPVGSAASAARALPPMNGFGSPGAMSQQSFAPNGQVMQHVGQDNVSATQRELIDAHKNLSNVMETHKAFHVDLELAHTKVMEAHKKLMAQKIGLGKDAKKEAKKHPMLGVIRLDYNYPPSAGDIDSGASFGYDIMYRVIPGFTFEMAQSGKFTEAVERNFAEGIKFLESKGCNAITGDCGFMMAFQVLARKIASRPIFMSSMVQCPVIACAFDPHDLILILTANGKSLTPQKEVLLNSCGFDVDEDRFIIVGCQDVPGFDAVSRGEAVPVEIVQPGIVKMTMEALKRNPNIRAILLECTELPPYADALRASTGLPVWDAITGADFYINAFKDNPRFGLNDWQAEWDGVQDEYKFGQNLIESDKKELVFKVDEKAAAKAKAKAKTKAAMKKIQKQLVKQQAPSLGVIRLDYNYPPSAGDIDCPGSFDYDVVYRVVPGLTFEMAQSGKMTPAVQKEFETAVKWLEAKGVCGITGDCGFMMAFQPIARDIANIPCFMSSMVQCPMVSVAFDKYDIILILTANSKTLGPQKDILLNHCGFDVDDSRFVIRGCENVPGFDEVAKGGKVDVEFVTPGIVKMTEGILKENPSIRAIILECTELPPYADALRAAFDLPVFDAITCTDFFVSARKDNPRFGLNQWQNDWDGTVDEYKFGENLTADERSRVLQKM